MLTKEQQAIVDTVCSHDNDSRIIAVNAVAGSGKTSTADAVTKAYNPSNGFYTAFNRAIVKDSEKRFGKMLQCKTIHALAYKYCKPSKSIEDLNYLTIKEPISYEDKALVIETIDDFFRLGFRFFRSLFRLHGRRSFLPDGSLFVDFDFRALLVTRNHFVQTVAVLFHNVLQILL